MNQHCVGWSIEEAKELIDTHVRARMPLGPIPAWSKGVVERWETDPDGAVLVVVRWSDYRGTTRFCRDCFFKQIELFSAIVSGA